MGMWTVIGANKEQAEKLYKKHMAPLGLEFLTRGEFSYDDEDGVGFCTFYTLTGKKIECQLRGDEPCFVSFMPFGDIRYDIAYPDKIYLPMYEQLKKACLKLRDAFWKGSQI